MGQREYLPFWCLRELIRAQLLDFFLIIVQLLDSDSTSFYHLRASYFLKLRAIARNSLCAARCVELSRQRTGVHKARDLGGPTLECDHRWANRLWEPSRRFPEPSFFCFFPCTGFFGFSSLSFSVL